MVRADTLARAKELKEIYNRNTQLDLAFVSGKHSLGHVKGIISKLRNDELQGIVCVNMFGKINLPNLKIAAIHSPHKSLAVTLQFIGRFARAGQADIGRATFLAEPISSQAEIGELYETGAIWRDVVENLAGARLQTELHTREVLDSFAIEAAPDMNDFSLYTVRPYFHAKLFAAADGIDLTASRIFPTSCRLSFKGTSDPHGATVYLTREAIRSPWSTDERFTNVVYDIFIFHHTPEHSIPLSSAHHAAIRSSTTGWRVISSPGASVPFHRATSAARSSILRRWNFLVSVCGGVTSSGALSRIA